MIGFYKLDIAGLTRLEAIGKKREGDRFCPPARQDAGYGLILTRTWLEGYLESLSRFFLNICQNMRYQHETFSTFRKINFTLFLQIQFSWVS